MSEQRIDSGAEAAALGSPDVAEGQGLMAPGAHDQGGAARDPELPSAPPQSGEQRDTPVTEGARSLVESVRSLEEDPPPPSR